MTAEEILAGMARVYADCRTYRDSGCVRTDFLSRRGRLDFASNQPFRTAFVRPDRFRFEFSSHFPNDTEMHRYIVHMAGRMVRTWWDLQPGVELQPSLGLALAGATGVSGGAAYTVPALLLPREVVGRLLTELDELVRLEDEAINGVTCLRVQGRYSMPPEAEAEMRREVKRTTGWDPGPVEQSPTVLWIEAGTLLLRRIEEHDRSRSDSAVTVTDYDPVVNGQVPGDDLVFDPPAGDDAEPGGAPDRGGRE